MSSGSLFDSEPRKSSNWKMFLIGFLVLIVVFSTAYGLYLSGKPREKTSEEWLAEEIRDSTVMMLAQPTFSGDEFEKQILGEKGKLYWFDRKTRQAYFFFPEVEQVEFDDFLNKYFVNRAKVVIGAENNGEIKLDQFTMPV